MIFSLGLFSAKIQFSLQLRFFLSFLNCLEAFKLRFFYQTYVVGPNQLIECSSVLESVDRAFKLLFLLQLNYPEEFKHLWEFKKSIYVFPYQVTYGHTNCWRILETVEG